MRILLFPWLFLFGQPQFIARYWRNINPCKIQSTVAPYQILFDATI